MRPSSTSVLAGFVALVVLAGIATAPPVTARKSARPTAAATGAGPSLATDPAVLRSALSCPDGFRRPARPVVLLVHGTGTTAARSWPFGFGRVLPAAGFDWCMVELPDHALTDIQTSTEYVVAAVRTIVAATGRRVSLVGHSQGALESRWAVRWWPDVRAAVDDLVSLAGSNQGTGSADVRCAPGSCPPAVWQQRLGARFIAAVNRDPVPAGPSYTAVYSLNDEIIQPVLPTPVSVIPGARNIAVQSLCPARPVNHMRFLYDAAVVSVALDALAHAGPAEPARFDRSACLRDVPPEVDRIEATASEHALNVSALALLATDPGTTAEPPLREYAR